jgi:thiol-disulfide isomerase/thioredoxin
MLGEPIHPPIRLLYRFLLTITMAASFLPAVRASDDTAAQVVRLRQEVEFAYTAYQNGSQGSDNWATYVRIDQEDVPKILDLLRGNKSFDGLSTIAWIVLENRLDQGATGMPTLKGLHSRVIELLLDRYSEDPGVGRICWYIGMHWWPAGNRAAADLFDAVGKRNKDPAARACAIYAAAYFLKVRAASIEFTESLPDDVRFTGPNVQDYRVQFEEAEAAGGSSHLNAQAAEKFRAVIVQYGSFPMGGADTGTCGQAAQEALDEIEHFCVGVRAPDITGTDLRGQPLHTSDFRGKIVVLSFWGSWCGPCMAMVPIERRLAERLAGKAVALVGVNSDLEIARGLAAAVGEQMTWPSFWNGPLGSKGPISKEWHVVGWPSVFVLDSEGIIRFKSTGFGLESEREIKGVVDHLLNHPYAVRNHSVSL